jgi:hypothetical protein
MVGAIGDFCHTLQSQFSRWNFSAERGAYVLQREGAAFIVEGVHERRADGRLEPLAALEGGNVISDGSVQPPHRKFEVIVLLVREIQPFHVHADTVVCRVRGEQYVAENGYAIGQIPGHEQIGGSPIE